MEPRLEFRARGSGLDSLQSPTIVSAALDVGLAVVLWITSAQALLKALLVLRLLLASTSLSVYPQVLLNMHYLYCSYICKTFPVIIPSIRYLFAHSEMYVMEVICGLRKSSPPDMHLSHRFLDLAWSFERAKRSVTVKKSSTRNADGI